jgi:hypothetical protein
MEALEKLKADLQANAEPAAPELTPRLAWSLHPRGVVVDFFGAPSAYGFIETLEAVASEPLRDQVFALYLRGPDEGVNGTCHWDIGSLVGSKRSFPKLEIVHIQQSAAGDHNRSIVGSDYEEGGVLSTLLERAPALRSLTTPSAPGSDFFSRAPTPLRFLSVDAGYDTQGFVGNLAKAACFPELHVLEFGEYAETYLENFESSVTPFSDYQALFESGAFSRVERFVWRNPRVSPAELDSLRKLRPKLQFLVVRATSEYVRALGS